MTSSAVVGSSAMISLRLAGQRDGDHDALAHAAGKLMRILLQPALRIGDADQAEQARCARRCGRRAVRAAMLLQRLGDLPPDGQHRIERGHRLLEHHADLAAADLAHLLGATGCSRSRPAKQDLALGDAARRIGNQAQDRQRADRLAGAALADDGHGLAGIDGVGHAVDGAHQPRTGAKLGMQIPHVEECRHWSSQRFVPVPHLCRPALRDRRRPYDWAYSGYCKLIDPEKRDDPVGHPAAPLKRTPRCAASTRSGANGISSHWGETSNE